MINPLARIALLVANFVVGVAILGLAGMLQDLADGLGVTIGGAGLLVTFGAIVLGIASPLMVWATSALDRRMLLTGTLLVLALGHVASAFVSSYTALLVLRMVMMAFAALCTPVAASTVALIVPEHDRTSAIVFVFLGFSLAVAAGLPMVTFLSAHVGWQATFGIIGVAALVSSVLLFFSLPSGLHGTAISLRSWTGLARNRLILLLLLLTVVQVSGQFVIFTYLAPLMIRLAAASVTAIGVFFSIFGVAGIIGNVIAMRLVETLKPWRTSLLALSSMLVGFSLWSFGAGFLSVMAAGMAFWGLGFASINSTQQARLVAAAPDLSSASVALNTSAIYIGQAIGSGLGGILFAQDLPRALGYVAMAFAIAALSVLTLTRKQTA